MPATICRHIKINGARCGSPALGGRTLCYHHRLCANFALVNLYMHRKRLAVLG